MRRVALVVAATTFVACTHDFGAFETNGDATTSHGDGAPTCTDPGGATFGGHCYFPLTTPDTWDNMKSACASSGAHLVSITSDAEQTFVQGIDAGNQHWCGLTRPAGASGTDPTVWTWVTGETTTSYQDWYAGEPNGDGPCARLRTGGGQWDDHACTTTYAAICERD